MASAIGSEGVSISTVTVLSGDDLRTFGRDGLLLVPGVVDEALRLDPLPKAIWMQLGLRDDTAAARAQAAGITVVMDRCIKVEHARLL